MDPKDLLLLVSTCDQPRTLCAAAGLKEHPLAPRDMWLACINAGTTDDGYWLWVDQTLQQAMDEHMPNVQQKKVQQKKAASAVSVSSAPQYRTISVEEFERKLKEGDF